MTYTIFSIPEDEFNSPGKAQRTQMCASCPARLAGKSPQPRKQRMHRCHEVLSVTCAGVLAGNQEGLKILHSQLYKESFS